MVVLPLLFLLGSLLVCGRIEAQMTSADMLKDAALSFNGTLTCKKWDCNCTYKYQRGCCCAADDMTKLEEETYLRMKYLWHAITKLSGRVHEYRDGRKVSFKANMDSTAAKNIFGTTEYCFGPFNTHVPIPYGVVTLNHGGGYNPSLGIFTATYPGVYVFSFTVYSHVKSGELSYHKVQMMRNGKVIAGVWENNREDGEDSATQLMILEMKTGDQVYMEMISGRKLCDPLPQNLFTGYMISTI